VVEFDGKTPVATVSVPRIPKRRVTRTSAPCPYSSLVGAFLLAFPALFSIVNPVGASLIFDQAMGDRTPRRAAETGASIGFYAFLVLLGSLLLGGYILNFFGVSLGALRVAGGLVVAIRAWGLLMDPAGARGPQDQPDRARPESQEDIAFFPLTMPFTTGPGSISVAIALSSQRPTEGTPWRPSSSAPAWPRPAWRSWSGCSTAPRAG
jgi:multiple antibiotic resistance protein